MNFLLRILNFACIFCGFVLSSQELHHSRRNFLPPSLNESYSNSHREIKNLNFYEHNAPRNYGQFLTGQNNRNIKNADLNLHNTEFFENHHNAYASNINGSPNRKPSSEKVFRTYGRGKAQVTRKGDSVIAANSLRQKSIHIIENTEDESNTNSRGKHCTECPEDRTVVATKGNTFVILPEPCDSKTWNFVSGPRPGSKIREGVHFIRGILIPRNKYCQYQYQVIVRRCNALKAREEDTQIECSESNVWGSQCTVVCGSEKEALGPTVLECMEDLKWSNPVPTCKSKMDCSPPKAKNNSKVTCQTANMTLANGDFIPNGSTCKLNRNGKNISLVCKDGAWRVSRKNKSTLKKNKLKHKSDPHMTDVCVPNPCQNGGTCLRSEVNKDAPLCVCRPKTQGSRCEIAQCEYNYCHNDGLCFSINQKDLCYCHPEFIGDKCQYRQAFNTGK